MRTATFEPADPQLNLWSDNAPAENWNVRESRRARRLSVRVSVTGRVEVVAPPRTSRRTIEGFLHRHRGWIERQREKARQLGLPAQPDYSPQVRKVLQRAVMATARAVLTPLLASVAQQTGFRYQKISIRCQRTRWGSCSSRGTISLNCCLMFQPAEVVRYLLIHELAHTVHMNHSARFWQAVEKHCPDYRRLDRELLGGWRRVPGWMM